MCVVQMNPRECVVGRRASLRRVCQQIFGCLWSVPEVQKKSKGNFWDGFPHHDVATNCKASVLCHSASPRGETKHPLEGGETSCKCKMMRLRVNLARHRVVFSVCPGQTGVSPWSVPASQSFIAPHKDTKKPLLKDPVIILNAYYSFLNVAKSFTSQCETKQTKSNLKSDKGKKNQPCCVNPSSTVSKAVEAPC